MRRIALGSGLTLAAAFLTGCGGGDAPTDASKDEFCSAYTDLYDNFGDSLEDLDNPDMSKLIANMKDWAEGLKEVGTPDNIPDDAREGFDLLIEAIEDVDADATQEELDQMGEDFGADAEKKMDAFNEWAFKTCPMEMPDLPDVDMGDLESEMSELESEMSDLQSDMSLTDSP